MHKTLTALLGVATVALPAANAVAAVTDSAATNVTKKTVVTKKVYGSAAQADRWGEVTVSVTVKKTTVVTNGVKKVTRKWTDIGGSFTYHTDRSLYIMQQSLPQLRQQALSSHSGNVDTISGATYSSDAFRQSLQEALAKVAKA
jgi:uncharacterized protein with FMN-binding domain